MKISYLFFLFVFPFLCQGTLMYITGSGLEIMADEPELKRQGVKVKPIWGSVFHESNIFIPSNVVSWLSYGSARIGGQVSFRGGIEVMTEAKDRPLILSHFKFDIKTGNITTWISGRPDRPFGQVNFSNVGMIKPSGTTLVQASIELPALEEKAMKIINSDLLGTGPAAEQQPIQKIPGRIVLNIDLALEGKINVQLVTNLHLDTVIDTTKLDVASLKDANFDVKVSLN